jgi:hypothetical protein
VRISQIGVIQTSLEYFACHDNNTIIQYNIYIERLFTVTRVQGATSQKCLRHADDLPTKGSLPYFCHFPLFNSRDCLTIRFYINQLFGVHTCRLKPEVSSGFKSSPELKPSFTAIYS